MRQYIAIYALELCPARPFLFIFGFEGQRRTFRLAFELFFRFRLRRDTCRFFRFALDIALCYSANAIQIITIDLPNARLHIEWVRSIDRFFQRSSNFLRFRFKCLNVILAAFLHRLLSEIRISQLDEHRRRNDAILFRRIGQQFLEFGEFCLRCLGIICLRIPNSLRSKLRNSDDDANHDEYERDEQCHAHPAFAALASVGNRRLFALVSKPSSPRFLRFIVDVVEIIAHVVKNVPFIVLCRFRARFLHFRIAFFTRRSIARAIARSRLLSFVRVHFRQIKCRLFHIDIVVFIRFVKRIAIRRRQHGQLAKWRQILAFGRRMNRRIGFDDVVARLTIFWASSATTAHAHRLLAFRHRYDIAAIRFLAIVALSNPLMRLFPAFPAFRKCRFVGFEGVLCRLGFLDRFRFFVAFRAISIFCRLFGNLRIATSNDFALRIRVIHLRFLSLRFLSLRYIFARVLRFLARRLVIARQHFEIFEQIRRFFVVILRFLVGKRIRNQRIKVDLFAAQKRSIVLRRRFLRLVEYVEQFAVQRRRQIVDCTTRRARIRLFHFDRRRRIDRIHLRRHGAFHNICYRRLFQRLANQMAQSIELRPLDDRSIRIDAANRLLDPMLAHLQRPHPVFDNRLLRLIRLDRLEVEKRRHALRTLQKPIAKLPIERIEVFIQTRMHAQKRRNKRPRRLEAHARRAKRRRLKQIGKIIAHDFASLFTAQRERYPIDPFIDDLNRIPVQWRQPKQITRRRTTTEYVATHQRPIATRHLRRHQLQNVAKKARVVVAYRLELLASNDIPKPSIVNPNAPTAIQYDVRKRNIPMHLLLRMNVANRAKQQQQHLRHIRLSQNLPALDDISHRIPRNIRMRTIQSTTFRAVKIGNRYRPTRHLRVALEQFTQPRYALRLEQ